ncbi:hypothetical protein SAMN05216559_4050 [Halomicrobium zhouii]|uniref:Uncharacterized protein n=1 Tax=Halomicrobium zhouii TaxID=767519 RepID=A0A1I6M9C4_9EURY|nr:hypothetical protein [Halomicrobium zhouii]SFS12247.1 hypothetical protein SAMN05216559_4050 [Halomicrobium zhouii]
MALLAFLGDENVALTIAALAVAYTFYRHNDTTQSEWGEELTAGRERRQRLLGGQRLRGLAE